MSVLLLALLLLNPAWANDPRPVQDPPLPPKVVKPEDRLEPTVTITRKGDVIEETYKRNGQVVMVKFIPKKGPPWYLLDLDGDGVLETRRDDFGDVQPVMWKLFTW